MRTRSSSAIARASASACDSPFSHIGAKVQFSITVMWGNRLNCWNTMPMRARKPSMSFRVSSTVTPSTFSVPR